MVLPIHGRIGVSEDVREEVTFCEGLNWTNSSQNTLSRNVKLIPLEVVRGGSTTSTYTNVEVLRLSYLILFKSYH